MKFWIGVVGTRLTYLRFKEENPWFCISSAANVGDMVLMYASKAAMGRYSGIFGLYEITLVDPERNNMCKQYGRLSGTGERPVYIELNLICRPKSAVSFQTMKQTPETQNAYFIRRNMQGTYFEISRQQLMKITELISKDV